MPGRQPVDAMHEQDAGARRAASPPRPTAAPRDAGAQHLRGTCRARSPTRGSKATALRRRRITSRAPAAAAPTAAVARARRRHGACRRTRVRTVGTPGYDAARATVVDGGPLHVAAAQRCWPCPASRPARLRRSSCDGVRPTASPPGRPASRPPGTPGTSRSAPAASASRSIPRSAATSASDHRGSSAMRQPRSAAANRSAPMAWPRSCWQYR